MGAKKSVVQKTNMASPLSQDVLSILRNQLRSGDPRQASSSVGPTQRTGGRIGNVVGKATAALPLGSRGAEDLGFGTGGLTGETQLASEALMKLINDPTAFQFDADVRDVRSPGNLITAMEQVFNRNLSRSAADLREGFGISGARFGTAAGFGEARLRSDALENFAQTLSGLEMQLNELGINRDLGVAGLRQTGMGARLGAISGLAQMGHQNILPILQLASQGVIDPELVVEPSMLGQIGTALIGGAGTALGGLGAGGYFRPK